LSFVSALPNGQWRRANLLKLHDKAIEFEGFASSRGVVSLRRFVEFIERLEAAGRDWAAAEPEATVENAVRIMSIHKSKGLEFPVVFLAELGSKFNDTLGLQVIDRRTNTRFRSLAHEVIAEQKLSAALEEEQRILYVAMTRARDRLVLSGCEKKKRCQDIVRNGFFFGGEPVADWQLCSCQSPLEWILYGLSEQMNLHSAFKTGLAVKAVDGDLFNIKVYEQSQLEALSRYIRELKGKKSGRLIRPAKKLKAKKAESKLLAKVKESLGWRYRFGEVAKLRAKESVTQLTHRSDEWIRIDYSRALDRKPRAVLSADLAGVVDNRMVGTATHLLISKLDLGEPMTKEGIETVKEKLLADGAISEGAAERIDAESIIGFFESELGREVFAAENKIWREWPFTFAAPVSIVASALPVEARVSDDETIVVQGIIDVLVRTPDGLLLIDFKTDDITAEEAAERAEVYRGQLEFYGRAASAILKKKLLGKWLYFLRPGCAIEVK
ncbi:MAG: 3'-5' exonuclease, partial [Planctomycetota bacterium]|jgi:ATP-dependent helicase/nuclease subunit A